ncbi:MAG: hypothetical protein EOM10_12605, partial [Opitutae bacterium]|nr:hypothetical protein [Opitutae bacterium]
DAFALGEGADFPAGAGRGAAFASRDARARSGRTEQKAGRSRAERVLPFRLRGAGRAGCKKSAARWRAARMPKAARNDYRLAFLAFFLAGFRAAAFFGAFFTAAFFTAFFAGAFFAVFLAAGFLAFLAGLLAFFAPEIGGRAETSRTRSMG